MTSKTEELRKLSEKTHNENAEMIRTWKELMVGNVQYLELA
jgi:hypothetical protein